MAALRSPSSDAMRRILGANSGGVSIGCWRSIPTACWHYADGSPGPRLGERCRAHHGVPSASRSEFRHQWRAPREGCGSRLGGGSFASPPASHCLPSSTASSRATHKPMPPPAPCAGRGDTRGHTRYLPGDGSLSDQLDCQRSLPLARKLRRARRIYLRGTLERILKMRPQPRT
jgi:hypothetical protein